MDKQAIFDNKSQAELFAAALAMGGGGYGAMRLLNNVVNPTKVEASDPRELSINIPTEDPRKKQQEQHLEQQRQLAMAAAQSGGVHQQPGVESMGFSSTKTGAEGELPGFMTPPGEGQHHTMLQLALAASGLPLGYMGMKGLHDATQGNIMDSQIAAKKKQYEEELLKAKFGAELPLTDAFCEGLAAEMNKTANPTPMDLFNSISNYDTHNPMSVIDGQLRDPSQLGHKLTQQGALEPAALVAMMAAAGVGGGMIARHNNNKEKQERSGYPSRVSLAPQL
ncbi:MAG: hypothetical protein EBU46_00795 [Nitrosomonadaceae bacterium]|nr:hypothetical protein [Nitrosomonadaceae bacterium]